MPYVVHLQKGETRVVIGPRESRYDILMIAMQAIEHNFAVDLVLDPWVTCKKEGILMEVIFIDPYSSFTTLSPGRIESTADTRFKPLTHRKRRDEKERYEMFKQHGSTKLFTKKRISTK